MNIVHVNNQYQLGGAETVMRQLQHGLREAGHESSIRVAWGKSYAVGKSVKPFYPRLLSRLSHSRFHSLAEALAPRVAWMDRAFRRLADSRAELVHLHNFPGDYASIEALAFLANRKPLVWTFHAFWGITGGCDHPRECLRYQEACGECPHLGEWPLGELDSTAGQLRLKLEQLANAPITVIAPSRHLAEKVRTSQVGSRWRVVEIPNGVAPGRFSFRRKHDPAFRKSLGLDPDALIVLVVNRNFKDPNKGFPLISEALSGIDRQGIQLVLAGQASEWAAAELSRSVACVDAGYITDRDRLAELYEAADVFLFASAAENFPCVILEAMSSKCCVVATPTSGVTEQIEHQKSGLLASEISGEALGCALKEALADPQARMRLGDAARLRVEQEFSEELMVARHIELYRNVLPAP